MSIRDPVVRACGAALIALACGACATSGRSAVPAGWFGPPAPGGPGGDGYGAWVVVRSGLLPRDALAGELIACRLDSLWVLTESGLRAEALGKVGSVRLYREVGTHGRVDVEDVVPTREASIMSPQEASIARAREAELRQWARFPQGWPPGLDRAALRPKPLTRP